MIQKGPALPIWLAAGIIGIVIGGPIGWFMRDSQDAGPPVPATGGPRGGGGPSGPGGPGGGFGGGGGGQPQPGTLLARMVRNIGTVEKVQNKGLSPQQARELLPVLNSLKSAEKLPEGEAQAKLDAVDKVLTAEQKTAFESLAPPRGGGFGGGGFGGGRGPGGPGGPGGPSSAGGRPTSGGPGGGGFGGQQADPEKPFANERNKQALDDLIAQAQAKAK